MGGSTLSLELAVPLRPPSNSQVLELVQQQMWPCQDAQRLENLLLLLTNPALLTLLAGKQGVSAARVEAELLEEVTRLREKRQQLQVLHPRSPQPGQSEEGELQEQAAARAQQQEGEGASSSGSESGDDERHVGLNIEDPLDEEDPFI